MEYDFEQRNKDLKELQSMTLEQKVQRSVSKILEFYSKTKGNCYLSCSGGADSMVLYDIINKLNLPIKVVFDDTGLEEPTVRATALAIQDVCVVRPEKSFYQVLTEIGYPIISKEVSECIAQARKCLENPNRERYIYRLEKLLGTAKQKDGSKSIFNLERYKCLLNAPFRISNQCCNIMKKQPLKKIKEYPIIGTMAEESAVRKQGWLKTGCNSFENKIMSRPLSFWTKQDTMSYIKETGLKIADCYGEVIPVSKDNVPTFDEIKDHYIFSGVQRTGCIFCMFGCHLDTLKGGINRFAILKQNNPQLFDYCMRGGKFDEQGLWIPHNGLGMAFVIEWLNRNLKKGKRQFIEGVDLSAYKIELKLAFDELNKIEKTRKKWDNEN